ncbi:MAG: Spy0128 family protein [Collinsella sp.]
MKANSEKTKQSKKATRRVLAGVLCGASVLSLVLSLVMPPISQAIANDGQAGAAEKTVAAADSSSESTDVENTNNGDTENQNSDDVENGVGDPQPEEQPKDESQAEDNEAVDDGTVSVAEEAAENEEAATAIANGGELRDKLQGVGGNQAVSFELANDIDYPGEIKLEKSGSNITLDLSGHKITHSGDNSNKPLFNITNNAALTVKDSNQGSDQKQTSDGGNNGRVASMDYDTSSGIPTKLTYYVTESTPNGTGTTETLYRHEVSINGAIVGTAAGSTMRLINVYAGGTFNLDSGVITQQYNCNVGNLIYAENGSTVNMSGGYVCGASSSGAGAGIKVSNDKGKASTLKLTGGVIAGNSAPSGGGVYAGGSTVTITGGVISGNSTLPSGTGFGGGIMAEGGSVTVSGGYITNNKYANFCGEDGYGDHGGAGLAARNGTHVTISGGQITGNYSEEAGGGVYVTNIFQHDRAWLDIKGGIIASNVSYRSEGAGIRVGQMIDAMISGASKDSPVYITNNHCMSRFDWGGGGIFVQGDSNVAASNAGRLFVYNSYISANTAGGYGGGVAVCPTGKTLVTSTEGTAIFGNSSAGEEHDDNHFNKENIYNKEKNTGNEAKPHLSGGGGEKTEDRDAYESEVFRKHGHVDFFLAAKKGHTDPIAAVIGKMLGGGDAQYSGSKELKEPIDIPANGGVQIYQSIGLTSGVQAGSDEATAAQKAATTFITGNYSWDHGGGIMSNGDLYLGQPADTYVYPSLKLKATKKLIDSQTDKNKTLTGNEFTFMVYRKDSEDPFVNGKFNRDACAEVGTANNDASGNITFELGEQFAASGTADKITYYLVEDTGEDSDITYDSAVYEIVASVKDTKTELMTVPTKENPNRQIPLNIHNYTIENVNVTKRELDKSSGAWSVTNSWDNVQNRDGYYPIACEDSSVTFTNEYTPYNSYGSWTPKATKVVKGGEMKEFTLEFADNEDFNNAETVNTKAGDKKSQTLSFVDKIEYTLDKLNKLESDSTGRGASNTFTYYVREQPPTAPFTNYTYDKSVYKITVKATDQSDKTIKCEVSYTKIFNAKGKEISADKQQPLKYGEDTSVGQSLPTFTNTYSTSLPLSGMSGVTLTYLAGAAVLCAAAAWMHIRRKANAKGGKRCE